jgi:branched-chain amino acid transport system permease protein
MDQLTTALLDGLAYGMVLFVISVGLTVTMGLMRIINLAHGAFAMIGGYVTAFAIANGWSFVPATVIGIVVTAAIGAGMEMTVFRPLYRKGELSQVLLTFGLVFVITASLTAIFGVNAKPIAVPEQLRGLVSIGYRSYPVYRLFLIGSGLCLALGLWLLLDRSRLGARLRASVENQRIARAMGIDVNLLFTLTFAFGCGLAALGAVLGAEMLPLEPYYAMRYMVLFFVVVAIGGLGSLKGSFLAAIVVGLIDTAGKFFVPSVAPYLMFLIAFALLLWRPHGLVAAKSAA